MPNHVYNYLHTDKPITLGLLHENSKHLNGGLAMLLMPRPQEQEDNWYAWNCANWGTKWGFYDQECHDTQLDFTTAWDKISDELLDRIAKHIPDFTLDYEEEQGWGGVIEYKNGVKDTHATYDVATWDAEGEVEGDGYVYRLAEDYTKLGEVYKKGWYYDHNLEEPVDSSEKIRITDEY